MYLIIKSYKYTLEELNMNYINSINNISNLNFGRNRLIANSNIGNIQVVIIAGTSQETVARHTITIKKSKILIKH